MTTLDDLQWHQLPRDGGQIVDVHYAADENYLYCRTSDRSDGMVTVERAARAGDEDEGCDDFQPWNGMLPNHGEWESM